MDLNFEELLLQIGQSQTFIDVFDLQLCFKLAQYLPASDIFTKLAILNKNFAEIVSKLKGMKHLWLTHFVYEFSSSTGMTHLKQDLQLIEEADHCFTYLEEHAYEYISSFPDLKDKLEELKNEEKSNLEFLLFKFAY